MTVIVRYCHDNDDADSDDAGHDDNTGSCRYQIVPSQNNSNFPNLSCPPSIVASALKSSMPTILLSCEGE